MEAGCADASGSLRSRACNAVSRMNLFLMPSPTGLAAALAIQKNHLQITQAARRLYSSVYSRPG